MASPLFSPTLCSLWLAHMTVFIWSLLSVGHRVALPLHVWVITGGQQYSVADPVTASQQLLWITTSHALYRCDVVSVALCSSVCRPEVV